MSYEAKLSELGFTIEPIELDSGKLIQAVRTGNLVFTSEQVPIWEDEIITGKVGADLTVEQAGASWPLCTYAPKKRLVNWSLAAAGLPSLQCV